MATFIDHCSFVEHRGKTSIVHSLFSDLKAHNTYFNKNPLSIFHKESSDIQVRNSTILDTNCKDAVIKGCVVDAIYDKILI